ncbi:MAG: AAA family ATPase [Deltaproteobacteria bacterium]|nr:AAA family ATPase [Deltaproteobacteria bacterium]
MTLVTGPAGAGKSTLLSQWLEELKLPSVWLSLDEADNDPKRFLSYLVEGLRQVAPDVGSGGDALLDSAEELVLATALEQLVLLPLSDKPVDFLLVLDDLHLISERKIHEALDLLIQHMPMGMHLVLASRSEPPLSLAKLRVLGEVNDINGSDLRFRGDEALSFYNQTMGLNLEASQAEQLEGKTEGWPAACQLVALRVRGGSNLDVVADPSSSHAHSVDYLVEEVLARKSEPVREFLEGISILDRVCDSLAAALLEGREPQTTLAELERENLLLIPLDDEGHWYRLHHLFSAALRRLLAARAPAEKAALHRRATVWFTDQGLIQEAIEHALQSEDQELLADLTQHVYPSYVQQGEYQTLARCLGALDPSIIDERPLLLMAGAWCGRITNDYPTVRDCSIRMAEAMERLSWPAEVRTLLQGGMDSFSATSLRLRGDPAAAIEILTEGLLRFGEPSSAAISVAHRMNICGLKIELGISHLQLGNLDEALMALESAQEFAEDTEMLAIVFGADKKKWELTGSVGILHSVLGRIYLMRADLESAEFEMERGRELSGLQAEQEFTAMTAGVLAMVKLKRGDVDGALAEVQTAADLAEGTPNPAPLQAWVRSRRALVDLGSGNQRAAESWVGSVSSISESFPLFDHDIGQARAQIAIELATEAGIGDAELKAIETQLQRARDRKFVIFEISWQVLQAWALQQRGETEPASHALESAAVKARPEGYGLFFRVPALRPALAGFKDLKVRAWAETWMTEDATSPSTAKSGKDELRVNPLSNRELEVLELISHGLSNRDIGERLFLSLGTVKAHTHNINTKLKTKNRTRAVHVGRNLGLLREAEEFC